MTAQVRELDSLRDIRHYLHELAQPMATVIGLVDLLLLEMDEHNPFFEEVENISQQLEKVLETIGEIRRLAREATDDRARPVPGPALAV